MEKSAAIAACVRMGLFVTRGTGPAAVGWAGPGRAVRRVSTGLAVREVHQTDCGAGVPNHVPQRATSTQAFIPANHYPG